MKKITVLSLLVAITLVLTACGRANETLLVSFNPSTIGDVLSENQDSPESQKSVANKPIYSLKNAVIVNDKNCTFTIIDITENGPTKFTLNALCENKTDSELLFAWDDVSVNGYMVDHHWAHLVIAGEKSTTEINFSYSDLEKCNITSVDEIVFTLRVHDNDDRSADDLVNDEFAVYPTGLNAKTVVYPERSTSASEQVIVDDENFTFVIESVEPDAIWGYTLNCYLENKTDVWLRFTWNDVSVNSYMVDPYWIMAVQPGKRAISEITFSNSDLERCKITSVDEIVFTLRVYDKDDWNADDLVNDEFAVYPTGLNAKTVVYPERSTSASEQVIVDDENCTFVIESIEADAIWGYTLNCYLENKTSDILMFTWDDVSVNGYMVDPLWSKEVRPGKRTFSEITFSDRKLERCNITSVDEIVFTLRVYDNDNWYADDLVEDEFAVYPTGLDASSVVYPERSKTASEQVIIDNESCIFIIESVEAESIWGYTLNCYLENKTSDPLLFLWDDVSVNGNKVDPFWIEFVQPGKRVFSDITFSNSSLKSYGISEVEEIEYILQVYNYDDWTAPDVLNEVFTYVPEKPKPVSDSIDSLPFLDHFFNADKGDIERQGDSEGAAIRETR